MAEVIPLHQPNDVIDDALEELSPFERDMQILKNILPQLINDISMIIGRPFELIWDPTIPTASTDCKAQVRMTPFFFLNGLREVGFGTGYHESGHIKYSPYGTELLTRAHREGGDELQSIMNIMLDRKDDLLTADDAPGFAPTLRERLAYICTMTRRSLVTDRLPKVSQAQVTKLLKNWKAANAHEDFFFAAKWHKRPRTAESARAMKYLKRERLLKAGQEELMWIAHRINGILGPRPASMNARLNLSQMLMIALAVAAGSPDGDQEVRVSPKLLKAINQVTKQFLGAVRKSGIEQLLKTIKNLDMMWPGPISTGLSETVPVKKMQLSGKYQAKYQELLSEVQYLVDPLVDELKKLDTPSEFTIYGQDEGELDLTEAARIATGLSGYYMDTVLERDVDAEIHLAVDCSSSMCGQKLRQAKQIGVLFSEALMALSETCTGHSWAFSSIAIYDLGEPSRETALMGIKGEAGNSDTHMLHHVGQALAKSQKRRRILLVLCDDGPDNIEKAREITQQLMARGIIVVHLIVGVHGTPNIYPIELLFTSMQECLEEFGTLLQTVIKNLR